LEPPVADRPPRILHSAARLHEKRRRRPVSGIASASKARPRGSKPRGSTGRVDQLVVVVEVPPAGGVVAVPPAGGVVVVVAGGVVVVEPLPEVVVEEVPAGVSVVVVVVESSPQAASVIRAEAPARINNLRMISQNLRGWMVPMNAELGGPFAMSRSHTVNPRYIP
jgi:hypothetical protein